VDIIDGYLKTVTLYLPRGHRKDIVAELADEIRSQVEEKESRLGRTLNEHELESLLRQFGDPVVVAARYRPKRRSVAFGLELIGPELFPYYLWLLLICAVATLGWVIYAVVHGAPNIPMLLLSIAVQFVIVTLVVVTIDFLRRRFPFDWLFPPAAMTPLISIARWRSVWGLVAWVVFGLLWLLLPHLPTLYSGSNPNLRFTPDFLDLRFPVLSLLFLGIAQRLVNLFRPDLTWLPPIVRLIANSGGLVIIGFMLKTYPYITVVCQPVDRAHYEHIAGILNAIILWGFLASWLWVFFLANVIANAWNCWQHVRRSVSGKNGQMRAAQDNSH
jgi:hypothetical protein